MMRGVLSGIVSIGGKRVGIELSGSRVMKRSVKRYFVE